MKQRFVTLAACAAVVLGAAGLAAAPARAGLDDVKTPERIENGFTFESISAVAREIGYEAEPGRLANGKESLRIATPDGLVFYAEPAACRGERCVGLVTFAYYRREGGYSLEALNRFNDRFHFMKAVQTPQGDAYLTRYIVSDYGVARGNIAINLVVFANLAQRLHEVAVEVSENNEARPLSASLSADAAAADPVSANFLLGTAGPRASAVEEIDHAAAQRHETVTDDMVNR